MRTPEQIFVLWIRGPKRWFPVGDAFASKRLMDENIAKLLPGTKYRWRVFRIVKPAP